MSIARIEDLYQIIRPRGKPSHSGWIQAFGLAVYALEFPGVSCPHPSTCPAKAWTSMGRHFGTIPVEVGQRVRQLRNHGHANVPVPQYECLFGQRRPAPNDPAGYAYAPGTRAGELSLFFTQQPSVDIIWPRDARALLVSDRLRELFMQQGITGMVFHPVTRAVVVPESHLEMSPGLDEAERWQARQRLRTVEGEPANIPYFEVEAAQPPSDCGIRWELLCGHCGYAVHDCKRVQARGQLLAHNGNDYFDLVGLGRPVCTRRVLDVLWQHDVEVFAFEALVDLLDGLVSKPYMP